MSKQHGYWTDAEFQAFKKCTPVINLKTFQSDYVRYKKGMTLYLSNDSPPYDALRTESDHFGGVAVKMNPIKGVDYV